MDIKNIIIMTILPIVQRDFDRFGIGYFISQNIDITVLNIREIIYKNIPVNYEIEKTENGFKYIEINTLNNFDKELKSHNPENTIIICFFGFGANSLNIYKILSKYNIKFGAIYAGAVPEIAYVSKEDFIDKLARLRKSYSAYTLSKKVLNKIYTKVTLRFKKNKIREYDFVVVGGKVGNSMKQNTSSKTKIIKAHALDREFILNDKNLEDISSKYIVYLDEYLPYHFDNYLVGWDFAEKIADIYYKKMNIFLDYLSKRYDKEVVICAHPRSEYHKYKVWNNKKIVLFETYNYVKQSFMCLTHASTSTNFAVILNKPISFLYLKEIEFYKFPIDSLAHSLGKNIVDIDLSKSELDKIDFVNVNQTKYQKYIEDYITENTEDKRNFWENVLQELEKEY
ncbi:hypothetical protein [Aliarcobacter cryaerophilus]|uniref:hypothetical protein n=1 Tax=Aliarcobacter cryaerophilus TaxID=28198 RepID=UPI0011DFD650|nr:hypothetical protein [Aliarcobacter cryaerophilus]